MTREARRRGGNDHEAAQDADPSASMPAGQGDNPGMPPADEAHGWNPAERVRLQITLDAETAFKLDSIARRARKPRGVIVARMIGQICKGYRSPTIPKAVNDLPRARADGGAGKGRSAGQGLGIGMRGGAVSHMRRISSGVRP